MLFGTLTNRLLVPRCIPFTVIISFPNELPIFVAFLKTSYFEKPFSILYIMANSTVETKFTHTVYKHLKIEVLTFKIDL